jgi:hypothetical protein
MKRVKNQKKVFLHIQVNLKQIWNNFFYVITPSQISLPEGQFTDPVWDFDLLDSNDFILWSLYR